MPPIISTIQSFLIILLSVLLYGAVHSLLASLNVKDWMQKHFGGLASRLYRLAYNIFAVLSFLPVLALPAILEDHSLYRINLPWLALSLAGQGLAILALLAGLQQTGIWPFLGFQQLVRPHTIEKEKLVAHGLYRWVRHPLYSAGLVFIWLTPIMTSNILALNLGLSLYIVLGALVEERKLLQQFGEAYRQYRRQTPMLLPWMRGRAG